MTSSRQDERERDAFTHVPSLAEIIEPLARRLPEALKKAKGRPAVSNDNRALLRELDGEQLAATVVHAVLSSLLGWLKTEDEGRGPVNACVLQDVGMRIGTSALRAYVRATQAMLGLTPRQLDVYIEDPHQKWTLGVRTAIGLHLLTALNDAVPTLLRLEKRWQDTFLVRVAPEAIADFGLDAMIRAAAHRPMVEPPKQWGPGERGGYRYALAGSVPLVRSMPANASDPVCPDVVYRTLNALQGTAWRVNRDLLNWLPAIEKRWGLMTSREHDDADERHVMMEAELEKDESALYFVHSLDFRGRVYPVATYLSPQGPDLARALLVFAEGRTIKAQDAATVAALDQYGRACRGGKGPLDLAQVLQIGRDPVGMGRDPAWWAADEPWQYLAYCLERAALQAAHDRREPYESHLPVWQDASANGLQHMSYLLGDETLAPLVNVLGRDEGEDDVYEVVAREMTTRLRASNDQRAKTLLTDLGDPLPRDVAKLPTMLFGYGGTKHGMAERFAEKQRRGRWLKKPEYRQLWLLALYFADTAWEVLREGPTTRAFELRERFQRVGRAIGRMQTPATWRVPGTGFVAGQWHSFETAEGQLSFKWRKTQKKAHRVRVLLDRLPTIEKGDHARSLAPNVIHSLDAAHLMLTVDQMPAGVPIATVHDGFATHATAALQLADAFKHSFITLYAQGSVLENLWEQFRKQCASIPDAPPQGTLYDNLFTFDRVGGTETDPEVEANLTPELERARPLR